MTVSERSFNSRNNFEEIGRLSPDAMLKELGDCIELIIDHRGKTPKKLGGDWVVDGIKAISAKNVHNGKLTNQDEIRYVAHHIYKKWMKEDVKKGDCLIASEGATLGEHLYWDFDYPIVLSQRLFCIRTNDKILDKKYFYAFVTSKYFQDQIHGRASGTSVFGLRQTELLKMLVPIFPIDKQKYIGELHYSISKKIDLLNRQNITLERMAETLFRQWFIEDAQESWEEVELEKLVKIQRGISYSGETLGTNGVGIPMHSLNSVNIYGDYKYEGIKTFIGKPKENQLLKPGDLLIINTDITPDNRIIGWPIFVPEKFEKSVCTHHLYMVELISNKVTKLYLFFLLKSKKYREEMANASNGTTVSMLSKNAVENIRLKIPESEKINKFEDIANKLLEKKALNQSQIETLEKLRDNLLPKLMSGEVRVVND